MKQGKESRLLCPKCNSGNNMVTYKQKYENHETLVRSRICKDCNHRFRTYEMMIPYHEYMESISNILETLKELKNEIDKNTVKQETKEDTIAEEKN